MKLSEYVTDDECTPEHEKAIDAVATIFNKYLPNIQPNHIYQTQETLIPMMREAYVQNCVKILETEERLNKLNIMV